MKFTSMKTWIFVFIAVRVFLEGVEKYIILPTAWFYMECLGQTKVFLGIVLSAFSVSAVFAAPIIGILADKFGHVKYIAIICFLLQIGGNVIYSIPISAIFPLVGRFISGIGNAAAGVFYGQMVLYTAEKHCAKVFLFLDGMFILGTTFGPFISSFLLFNVNILGWKINAGNSPGVIMAIIWFIVLVVGLFLPNDFGEGKTSSKKSKYTGDEDEDPIVQLYSGNSEISSTKCNSSIFCVFYQLFFSVVYSTIVTFYVPLLANQVFHLQFIHVKLLFLNSTLFALALFFSLYILAEYVDERILFGFLNIMQLPAMAILTYFAITWNSSSNSASNYYILIAYICIGMPYFQFAFACSMLSKITHPKDVAFYQGSSYATVHLAIVIGRVISGFVFSQSPLLFFCLAMALSWIIGALWLSFEFQNLGPAKVKT